MRKLRWSALGLGFVLALGINLAEAQVTGTVVLKDGQKHTGRNIGYRMDRREVAVRTSQHEEPRMNVDQVAYIDFGGAPARDLGITGTQQAVVLRDGTVIRGQIIEVGHEDPGDEKTPYRVIVRTEAGEERRLPVEQVGRVYFASPTAVGTTGEEAQLEKPTGEGLVVSGRQQWTPTGMTVRGGERITFHATGQVQLSDDPKDIAGAAGSLAQRKAANAPLPDVLAGALIARVGATGEPFPIGGPTSTVTMPAAGQLFLGINDDHVDDNRGEFRVKVERAGRQR